MFGVLDCPGCHQPTVLYFLGNWDFDMLCLACNKFYPLYREELERPEVKE